MIKVFYIISLFLTFNLNASENKKFYYVDGMHCQGCVSGVRSALKHLGYKNNQITKIDFSTKAEAKNTGHFELQFLDGQYKGQETDCAIVSLIKKNPGYVVYWNKKDKMPCK